MDQTLSVAAIRTGTVIDHIPAGHALLLIPLLKLKKGTRFLIGSHLFSTSMVLKDLIKIEDLFLTPEQWDVVALFAPQASINEIDHYAVVRKIRAVLPKQIRGILRCLNPRCITQVEPLETRFNIEHAKETICLKCAFCDKLFNRELF